MLYWAGEPHGSAKRAQQISRMLGLVTYDWNYSLLNTEKEKRGQKLGPMCHYPYKMETD